ncbi:MAG: histidinol dehydrogenase, partial [Calditrichaeota bacterium]
MEVIRYPRIEDWPALLRRPTVDFDDIAEKVRPILEQVRREGDQALLRWTEKLDGVRLRRLDVTPEELAAAETQLPAALKTAIELARKNIEAFHRTQQEVSRKIETMPGVCCWRRSVPIDRVGLYIPGGTAPLFSTILMLAIPAQIAGCREIVLCTPPDSQARLHPA